MSIINIPTHHLVLAAHPLAEPIEFNNVHPGQWRLSETPKGIELVHGDRPIWPELSIPQKATPRAFDFEGGFVKSAREFPRYLGEHALRELVVNGQEIKLSGQSNADKWVVVECHDEDSQIRALQLAPFFWL